jgi:cell shape-determining protein MreC
MKRYGAILISLAILVGITQVAFSSPLWVIPSSNPTPWPLYVSPVTYFSQGIDITRFGTLNLTPAQIEKIKALQNEYTSKIQSLYREIQDLVSRTNISLSNKTSDISGLNGELLTYYTDYAQQLAKILSPQQLLNLSKREYWPGY